MKKVLILSVTAGNGHNACAYAMQAKLKELAGDEVDVKVVDLLKTCSTRLYCWLADEGYNLSLECLLPVYNAFFRHFQRENPKRRYHNPPQGAALSTVEELYCIINEYRPDVIYGTHFYAGIAITDLRLAYPVPATAVVAALDYVYSPFWQSNVGVDRFVFPHADLRDEALRLGFSETQLLPYGIPVNAKFNRLPKKEEARERLGLEPDLFTVIVLFGGGQWSGSHRIFKGLLRAVRNQPVQIIKINGKDRRSYAKTERLVRKRRAKNRIVNVGFTDQMELYMAASDLAVTKYGGTSVTEMINAGLPGLVTEHLAQQERANLVFMKGKGAARSFRNKKELKRELFDLMNRPEALDAMREALTLLRTDAIGELAEFILNCPNAVYDDASIAALDYKKVRAVVKRALKQAHRESMKKARTVEPSGKTEVQA